MPAEVCSALVDGHASGQNLGFVELDTSTYVPKNIQQFLKPIQTSISDGFLQSNNGSGAWAWPTSSTLAPACTVGCGRCTVAGDHVELLYWPPAYTNMTRAPDATPVTAVFKNVTLTSPTLYISYSKLYVSDACKAVGSTHYNTIVPVYNQSALSSQFSSPVYSTAVQWSNLWYSFTARFNVTDLYQTPVPMSIYTSQPWCAEWATDHVSVQATPTAPSARTSTTPAQPSTTTSGAPATALPVSIDQTIKGQSAQAGSSSGGGASSSVDTAHASQPNNAGTTTSTTSSSRVVQNVASAIASVLGWSSAAVVSLTSALSVPQPQLTFNAISALLAPSIPSGVPEPASAIHPALVSSAGAASTSAVAPIGIQPGSAVSSVAAEGFSIASPVIAPRGSTTAVPPPAPASSSSRDVADALSALSSAASAASQLGTPAAAQSQAGQPSNSLASTLAHVSPIAASQQYASWVPSSSSQSTVLTTILVPITSLGRPPTTRTENVATITANGAVMTASQDPGATIVVLGSVTLSVGSLGTTIGGRTFSLGASGLVVDGASKVTFGTSTTPPTGLENIATLSASGEIVTISQSSGALTAVIGPSDVLYVGGPATTIGGRIISLAPSGLLVDGTSIVPWSTRTLPGSSGASTLSIIVASTGAAGHILQVGVVAGSGSTIPLSVGGSATSIDGEQISLVSSGLVVNGGTRSWPALSDLPKTAAVSLTIEIASTPGAQSKSSTTANHTGVIG
ncbi:hypothetical protein LTR86_001269 [Recurvomyces mirabilis]|nr:hypothetical protein LTR86_001269 [Recurvomyces mirabilis]